MSCKSAKVKVRAEKARSALNSGSAWIVSGMLVLALGAPSSLAEDCNGTWDVDIGTSGMDASGLSSVRTFEVFNDMTILGGQNELYAGGYFKSVNGRGDMFMIAKWVSGSEWDRIDGLSENAPGVYPLDPVNALQTWGTGSDYGLYVAGDFALLSDDINEELVTVNYIVQWDGSEYKPITYQSNVGVNGIVRAMTVFDHDNDTQTPVRLVVGGDFTTAGGVTVNHVAMWDGTSWTALGSGTNSNVHALRVFDDGTEGGPSLFAAGGFDQAGGQDADYVAKWQDGQWKPVGFGFDLNNVHALEVYNDGTGQKLYAAGDFIEACGNANCNSGNIDVNGVAAWDGTSWSALGTGVTSQGGVLSLYPYKEGYACLTGGPFLFAGGSFTSNDAPGNGIVRWDGTNWTALEPDGSSDGVADGDVRAMILFENDDDFDYYDGTVNSLFIGGTFTKVRRGGADVSSGNVSEWTCRDYECIWDIDGDGLVNPVDFGKVQSKFGCDLELGDPDCIRSDIDGDCQVNPVDAGLVSSHYGDCQP